MRIPGEERFGVVLIGTVDGANNAFTFPSAPVHGSERVYVNRQRLYRGDDYQMTGTSIWFNVAPPSGGPPVADYAEGSWTGTAQGTATATAVSYAEAGEAFAVGSIFIATVSTNPATLLGYGTWAAWGAGKFIVGLDSGDTDFDTAEETGGAKTHTHAAGTLATSADTAGTPAGTVAAIDATADAGAQASLGLGAVFAFNSHTLPAPTFTGSALGGHGHTVASGATASGSSLPPYITAYLWERTA